MNNSLELYLRPNYFLSKFNPGASRELFKYCKNIEYCVRSEAPTLSTVYKTYGLDFVIDYIALWISTLNDFGGFKSKMNDSQVYETAELIYNDYYYFKISDLYLFFTNVKRGKYGQMYENLDGFKLLAWISQYADERLNYSENAGGKDKSKYIDLREITTRPNFKKIGHGKEKE